MFSALGTAYHGYFFAFHLLNIVYNNQLLQRVIMAVTLNGKVLYAYFMQAKYKAL